MLNNLLVTNMLRYAMRDLGFYILVLFGLVCFDFGETPSFHVLTHSSNAHPQQEQGLCMGQTVNPKFHLVLSWKRQRTPAIFWVFTVASPDLHEQEAEAMNRARQ